MTKITEQENKLQERLNDPLLDMSGLLDILGHLAYAVGEIDLTSGAMHALHKSLHGKFKELTDAIDNLDNKFTLIPKKGM